MCLSNFVVEMFSTMYHAVSLAFGPFVFLVHPVHKCAVKVDLLVDVLLQRHFLNELYVVVLANEVY